MDDLENRSKRNIVIWGLREQSEGKHIENFLEELFKKHMDLNDIEVMQAHRTNTLPQRSRFQTGVAGSDAPLWAQMPPPPCKNSENRIIHVMFMTGMGNITRNKMVYAIESIFID